MSCVVQALHRTGHVDPEEHRQERQQQRAVEQRADRRVFPEPARIPSAPVAASRTMIGAQLISRTSHQCERRMRP
jgi:hypothetical protein